MINMRKAQLNEGYGIIEHGCKCVTLAAWTGQLYRNPACPIKMIYGKGVIFALTSVTAAAAANFLTPILALILACATASSCAAHTAAVFARCSWPFSFPHCSRISVSVSAVCGSFVGFNEWPKRFSDVVVASSLGQQHVGSAALRTHEREPVL